MEPITNNQFFLATMAGEYDGELPEALTMDQKYYVKIIQRLDSGGGGSVSPEEIDAAIEDYLNSHDADIVTEQELSDALAGYYDKDAVDTTLNEKQDTLTAGDNISIETINGELTISATDTTYSDATQQTHGLMSAADKTKLDGITAAKIQAWDAAEQNVNADWNAESGDAQILHKPDLSVYALAANVTKSALGIDNVDNTSDADKPISTAAETALAGKVDKENNKSLMSADEHTKLTGIESGAQVNTVTGVKGNAENDYRTGEINISPANIGLGNVDNTSDANKPISTATQTALAGKAAVSHVHDDRYYTETEIDNKLGEKSNTGHLHDDRYYTEDETDTLLSGKADSSDIPDVSSFITKAVNDLTNYYTKSETYTQTEIDNMVSAIPKFAIEVVQVLPSQNISPTTVYLLTVQSGQQGNMYDEYIHVGNSWELLGTQTVDLSGYYTSAQVDALLSGLPVAGHTHDDRYYTESEIDSKIQTINTAISGKAASDHNHDDRYYTETEIDNKLGEKSNTGHSHAVADVTGLDSALSGKAPASHTHALADVTGLADALAAKADAAATQTALNAKQDALTAGENITIETVNGELTISATDTTYSAGSGISISNGEISNSAPNVQADWNASGTAAEILNKPTIPNYSNATTSAAGLMSATDKSTLNAINAGTRVSLMSGAIDLVSASNNRTALSSAVSNFRAIEIRYAMYYTGASSYTGIIRAVNRDGQGNYGNIAALVVRADTAGSLSLYMCNLQLSGSNLTLSDVNNVPSFYVYDVLGYK